MLRKEFFGHLLITLVWLSLISVLRWQWQSNLVFLWLGGLLGTFLLDIDHLLYSLVVYPHHLTSMRVRHLLEQRRLREAFVLLGNTREERIRLNFHNALFQSIFYLICFFVLTSTGSLFGAGLILAMALHLLKDELWNLLEGREEYLRSWLFWPIRGQISLAGQRLFVVSMLLIFLGLNLFLI